MGSTLLPPVSDRTRTSFRRVRAFLLALAIEILVVLLFLFIVPSLTEKPKPKPTTFGFDIDPGDAKEPSTATKAEKKSGGGAAKAQPTPVKQPDVPTPPVPPLPSQPSNVIWMSKKDYSAVNKAIQSQGTAGTSESANKGQGDGDGHDSALASGRGPNGEPVYAAEWYRRPTNRELSTYMPPNMREGWGLIICRTASRYHVEDCKEVADSPRGSRLAGAVRQAAFQFLVRPPRVGGKELVGAWVSIRIDYTVTDK